MFSGWKGKIVDIYIFKQVLNPFLFGVAIITVIMLSSFLFELTDLIIIKNVPLNRVLRLLVYQLPEIIVRTFPMAILFATMSGLGRLNRENEFTALRMGGISLYRLILPLVIFGIIISGMTYYMNEQIVPWSNHRARTIIRQTILQEAMPDVQEDIFFKGPKGRLFYIKEFDEKTSHMSGIVIFNKSRGTDYPEIITADSGKVIKNKWQLYEGIIHRYDQEGHLELESSFTVMDIELAKDLGEFYGEQKTPSEMSRKELAKEINLFRESGIRANSLLVDYHLKLAIPFIPLIFILIGTPLSLGNRDNRALNVILTIGIIFLYYFLLSLARSLGRNDMLSPLAAAWLPNLIFGLIGIIFLLYRELWQNWITKLLPGFFILMVFISIPFLTVGAVMAQNPVPPESGQAVTANRTDKTLNISADSLSYDEQGDKIEALGNIMGKYGKLHLHTDRVIIKLAGGGEEVYSNIEEIKLDASKLSGCDLEEPHYYFRAEEVTIYPDDHLEARHVVLWELNGKLPLFYWPYLYISLKERSQRLVPEVGYNATRGWFLKLTYNYWYEHRLPGAIYTDYYTISGPAGGFMQYFLYEPERKGSVYFYSQQNRTDLPGLFEWEGKIDYQDTEGSWQTDTELEYTSYQDHNWIKGDIELTNSHRNHWFNFDSDFDSLNYYQDDEDDEKELDLDLAYIRSFNGGWELNLDYNRDYLLNPDDGLQTRWGSRSYLAKNGDNYQLRLLMERYAPRFSDDDEGDVDVTFYRWPEIGFKYYPNLDLVYQASLGRYYEDRSETAGYRFLNKLDYSKWWKLTDNTSFRTEQLLTGKIYRTTEPVVEDEFQAVYRNGFKLKTSLTDNLTWTTDYRYATYGGETPFTFDRPQKEEEIRSGVFYQQGGFDASLNTGYDIYDREYLPLRAILNWEVSPEWQLGMGTSYDFNDNTYGDLALTSNYKDEKWEINSGLKFDINSGNLEQWDNQLIYELKDEWYFEIKNSYDYVDNVIEEANLILKKNFHCRELWFTYDHLEKEFMVEYHINLLPDHGFKFGSSKDKPFMYDLGIMELIEEGGDY